MWNGSQFCISFYKIVFSQVISNLIKLFLLYTFAKSMYFSFIFANYGFYILVALVEEVYFAQRERDEAIMSRLRLANEEQDEAIAQPKNMEMSLKVYVHT